MKPSYSIYKKLFITAEHIRKTAIESKKIIFAQITISSVVWLKIAKNWANKLADLVIYHPGSTSCVYALWILSVGTDLPHAVKRDARLFTSGGGCVVLEYLGAMVALSTATTQREMKRAPPTVIVSHTGLWVKYHTTTCLNGKPV